MKLRIENERLKRIPYKRIWFSCSIQEIKQKEFEIVKTLSKEYSVKSLCEIMNISISGYYKWLKTNDILNRYEINRRDLGPIIRDIHKRKSSYGYHRINYLIRKETGWLKKQTYIDFNQDDYDNVEDYINAIIYDHNYLRPSYALNYKNPIEYRTQLGFK